MFNINILDFQQWIVTNLNITCDDMNSYKNRRSVYWLSTALVLISLHRLMSWLLSTLNKLLVHCMWSNIKTSNPQFRVLYLVKTIQWLLSKNDYLNKGHDCIFIFTSCPLFRFVSSFLYLVTPFEICK